MNQDVARPDNALRPPTALSLLRLYHEGDSAFVSRHCSVLTRGSYAQLDAPRAAPCTAWAASAARLLNEVALEGEVEPLLIGALGFGPHTPPRLRVPEGVVMGAGADAAMRAVPRPTPGALEALTGATVPTGPRYRRNVEDALARIAAGDFQKVVLSRSLRLDAQVDVRRLLQRLLPGNTHGYTFAVDLADERAPAPRTLVGASPELLLARHGRQVVSHPLAGSVPRAHDPAEDQARARRLLASAKDLREHAYVVEAVAQTLSPYCRKLIVPPEPSLVATTTMWHLGTRIVGELHNGTAGSLELALALHPTPAVCGHPCAAARDFIARSEGFDRGYFTGLVGWTNAQGDGEWAVTIRCAEIAHDHATLYAGAGVVQGSDPALELAETEAKMQTMLGALQHAVLKETA